MATRKERGLIAETEFTEEDELPLARLQEEGRDLTQWAQSTNISDFDDTDLRQDELIDENLEVAEYPDDLQIVQSIMNPPRDEDSNEEEPEEEVEIPTTKEAMIALKTVMSYVECKYPEKEQFLNAADQLEQDINKEILSSRSKQYRNIIKDIIIYTISLNANEKGRFGMFAVTRVKLRYTILLSRAGIAYYCAYAGSGALSGRVNAVRSTGNKYTMPSPALQHTFPNPSDYSLLGI
ncbi:hypothetical protein NQ318_004428 [Aromia moschata]|uniref:Uncharacterized protein n=1 Tax=Aromia moschata TaxID=1265417 RepID=A0AAV8Y5C5_9CUCU|nr:hypothetical protein NQ318_004428 [Aromia moschata]